MFEAVEEVHGYILDLIDNNKTTLGVLYVGDGSERLAPKYPAVLVEAGPTNREYHGTHKFQNRFFILLWVYHADITKTARGRNKADLELVTKIRKLLHADIRFGGNLIDSLIDSEMPGVINRPTGQVVVGTRMQWTGRGQEIFT